jgi:hypothetical protein
MNKCLIHRHGLLIICLVLQILNFSCVYPLKGKCIIEEEYKKAVISPSSILLADIGFEDTSLYTYRNRILNEIQFGLMRNSSSVFSFDHFTIPNENAMNIEIAFGNNEFDVIRVPKHKKWKYKTSYTVVALPGI